MRSLAGLPTNARVETVKDTGQVLLANAAYATEIPGIDLKPLSSTLRERTLKRLNEEQCTCGCGLTVAQCRINDPSCEVSLPVAKKILEDTVKGVELGIVPPFPDSPFPVPPVLSVPKSDSQVPDRRSPMLGLTQPVAI